VDDASVGIDHLRRQVDGQPITPYRRAL
jgi:hypothetical protein